MADIEDRGERSLLTAKGRIVEVLTVGPPDGLPLVFHHGTPGGVALYPPMAAAGVQRDLRLVIYGRPGYGGSSAAPRRVVADAAADVAAILDALGAQQFVTAGWSGGGPHALACARLLPGRCLAAASLAGVAPYNADGLDWLAGMAEDNVAEFTAALAGQDELTVFLTGVLAPLQQITGAQLAAAFGSLASAADVAAMTGELADYVAALFRAGLGRGAAGWRDDDLAFVRDWGFSPQSAGAPVAVWQGDQDMMVPRAHGQWLAEHIPAARAHFGRGTGHMHLPLGDVFDELLELAGR